MRGENRSPDERKRYPGIVASRVMPHRKSLRIARGYQPTCRMPQFSVCHTRLPSWLQVLQCAGWLNVLASCHSCASLLHCAVAWQMMSSEPQAAQTGVARAARLATFSSTG